MPFISKIEARAYARATEILERVETAVLNLFPELMRPLISMKISSAEGQSGDVISIVSSELEEKENCQTTFNFVLSKMKRESQRALRRSIDLRLDNDCVLFLRIDKQAAYLGEVELTDKSDVISVRFHFRDYPRCKRNDATQIIENQLQIAGEREDEN
jgi:RNA binding exosome subunit